MPRDLKIPKCNNLRFSPCGRTLASTSRDIFLWDSETGKKRWASRALKHTSHLAFDPSGELLAVKNTRGEIAFLRADNGNVIGSAAVPKPGEGSNICFTRDGENLISGTWDGRVDRYRVRDGAFLESIQFEDHMVTQICPLDSENGFAILHGRACYGEFLSQVPAADWASKIHTKSLPENTSKIAVLPDNALILATYLDIQILRGNTHELIHKSSNFIFKFCVNYGFDQAAMIHNDKVHVIDLTTKQASFVCNIPFACSIEYSPSSNELAVGSAKHGVLIFTTSELQP